MIFEALLEFSLTSLSFPEAFENALREFRERARITDEHLFDQAHAHAELGANILDQKLPGWARKVAGKHIYISNPNMCILARLFGSYTRGLDTLGIEGTEADRFGFRVSLKTREGDVRVHNSTYYYRKAWEAQIALRT
ncbi:MAG TPA: hypothetical protein VMU25_02015 [Candidatus Paceibacterota bacterium]|nr:hypothetical protein [Candidatus Paceibacterota bacterium]